MTFIWLWVWHVWDQCKLGLWLYEPGSDSSNVGSSRLSNSFMTISHTGWLRLGQFWALPLHLWGILKNRVYGQIGTRPSEAVMEASYTKNWCSIIWNCLFPPTLRYGARIPTIEPSEMFANLWSKRIGIIHVWRRTCYMFYVGTTLQFATSDETSYYRIIIGWKTDINTIKTNYVVGICLCIIKYFNPKHSEGAY